jgi:hypothetical protein
MALSSFLQPRVKARTPDMTAGEAAKAAKVKCVLDETYGKVVYFWQLGIEIVKKSITIRVAKEPPLPPPYCILCSKLA